jgi:hypothetical protein
MTNKNVYLRDSVARFSTSGFFQESVSPKPLSIPLGSFRIFSKIRVDIHSSRFATGVNNTGGKCKKSLIIKVLIIVWTTVANLPPVSTTLGKLVEKFAAGVVDTGGNFAAGVVDTGGKFATGVVDTGDASLLANISANFRKKFETVLMGYSGAGGKLIHEKTRSKKSRDTVPLNYFLYVFLC